MIPWSGAWGAATMITGLSLQVGIGEVRITSASVHLLVEPLFVA